ncbi:MAG: glucose-6-phosphate isomerase [Desulfobacterales bacterium]|nr:glucose-6-phosphate isomerase [Deltaproteobacteria bacterium]NNL41624.1 glucose-6-phosphate isomerase [Desulfobacterales bacterium]
MPSERIDQTSLWKNLEQHATVMQRPGKHLKNLLNEKDRLKNFSLTGAEMFFDFSRQRLDEAAMDLLFELSNARKIKRAFHSMINGEKVNVTENRAALHAASRSFSNEPVVLDGKDVMHDIQRVRDEIKVFSSKVLAGEIKGSTGKPFEHLVVVGIGGSYLGPEFVSTALEVYAPGKIKIHYLANVDIHNFGQIASRINPETTLWIVISKSYTTSETMANANQARIFMQDKGLDPSKHFITVTSKGSPGDDPSAPILDSFHMFDFIGGRYSVTSAVGGVPLSLYLGYDIFQRFLKGANQMDQHATNAPEKENLPLIAALISIWNNNFLGYHTQGIIPYATPLRKLAPHIQQLNMESNGKSVQMNGDSLSIDTGQIIFGEPGTNAQHSFFQLAHQGRPFPIDFIGVVTPQYLQYQNKSKGVTNHQELWANLISQPMALAMGKNSKDKARYFSGNRPSSTILLNDLSPENIGRLLAFYEAKTVFEAFIWGINPFDQFGVELGKTMASGIRDQIKTKNENNNHNFNEYDSTSRFYLDTLFSGKF